MQDGVIPIVFVARLDGFESLILHDITKPGYCARYTASALTVFRTRTWCTTVAIAALCFLASCRERSTRDPGQFWNAHGSFSVLAFRGDVREQLREFLLATGYENRNEVEVSATAGEINERVQFADGKTIKKAFWFAGGFTIVLDPEMVMAFDDHLPAFCTSNETTMIAAIWERVSQSAIVEEISSDGRRKSSHFLEGKVAQGSSPTNHPALAAQPNADGLAAVLRNAGLREEAFGNVTATVLTLTPSE